MAVCDHGFTDRRECKDSYCKGYIDAIDDLQATDADELMDAIVEVEEGIGIKL